RSRLCAAQDFDPGDQNQAENAPAGASKNEGGLCFGCAFLIVPASRWTALKAAPVSAQRWKIDPGDRF
ncbi:MAG: hypothetical protein AAFX86_14800, partial [Pseudomonadota bacterium]